MYVLTIYTIYCYIVNYICHYKLLVLRALYTKIITTIAVGEGAELDEGRQREAVRPPSNNNNNNSNNVITIIINKCDYDYEY